MATVLPPLPSYITLTVLAAELSKVNFKNSSGSPNTFGEPEDNNYGKILDCTFLELTGYIKKLSAEGSKASISTQNVMFSSDVADAFNIS